MSSDAPQVVIIGGPNGAGKTTISREVLANTLGIHEFVNADVIAAGLSGFAPERAAFAAGRIMLSRLRELATERASFAFETTLASRTFAPWLGTLAEGGYQVHVLYVWLENAELAIERVRQRVSKGGHHVPDDVVARRYRRSMTNFWFRYRPLAARSQGTWRLYDNSGGSGKLVARATGSQEPTIIRARTFSRFQELAHAGETDSNDIEEHRREDA
jgi:predicted ABC-type ATPase